MTKPTREELLSPPRYNIYTDDFDRIVHKHLEKGDWVAWEHVEPLKQAYLAQEEELKEGVARRLELIAMVEQLKAENQALRGSVQRFVHGEDKACLVCGKREPCKETPEACTFEPTPMELMRENKALKAKLEGTFRFETPKPGEPLRYHINEEDTLP